MFQGTHCENPSPAELDGFPPRNDGNRRVSIVIPSFNRANLVGGAIRSCIEQATDTQKLEVIVVDDGSSDGTLAELSRYGDLIRVVSFNQNSGRNVARNAGLKLATGRYVKFLDSDDRLFEGTISKEVALADSSNADVVIAGTQLATIERDGAFIAQEGKYWAPPEINNVVDDLLAGKAVPTTAALYRREYLCALQWDESLFKLDDWDWFIQACLLGGKIVTLNAPSYYWCAHPGQGTKSTSMLENALEHHAILGKLETRISAIGLMTPERERRLAQYYYKELRVLCIHDPIAFRVAVSKIRALDPNFTPRDEESQWWMRIAGCLLGFERAVRWHTAIKQSISSFRKCR